MTGVRTNSNKIKADGLADAVIKELGEYGSHTTDAVKKAVDKVTKETIKEIKEGAPKKSGKYRKEWASKDESSSLGKKRTVYNSKRYQLAHLLEKGHARRGGGRKVPGKEHIAPAEAKIEQRLMDELEREL